MTSIAQMVNVAQSMILTEGKQMVLTPTYHAFELYTPFQDATALPLDIRTPTYTKQQWSMPAVSGVAARGKDGVVYLALTNVDPRSEEHTSELQSLMRISYAVFCLKKKKTKYTKNITDSSKLTT